MGFANDLADWAAETGFHGNYLDAVEAYNDPFASRRSYWGDHDHSGLDDDGMWDESDYYNGDSDNESVSESESDEPDTTGDKSDHTVIDDDGNPVLTAEELRRQAEEANAKFEEYMGRSNVASSVAGRPRQPTDQRSYRRRLSRSRSPVRFFQQLFPPTSSRSPGPVNNVASLSDRSTHSASAMARRNVFPFSTRSHLANPGVKMLKRALGNVSAERSEGLSSVTVADNPASGSSAPFITSRQSPPASSTNLPKRVLANHSSIKIQPDSCEQALDSDVHLTKVVLKDGEGEPIDFDDEEGTRDKLLRAVQGFKRWEKVVVKTDPEIKEEAGSDDGSVVPEDSASNVEGPLGIAATSLKISTLDTLALKAPVGSSCASSFLTPEKKLVQAKDLVRGSQLLASSGETIVLKFIEVKRQQEQELVELLAGVGEEALATLKVTCSHRVMVRRGERQQPLQAGALKRGDFVYCSGSQLKELISVKPLIETIDIADITFSPDLPVEAFSNPPQAILSKGSAKAQTRRSKNRQSTTYRQGRLTSSALSQFNEQLGPSDVRAMVIDRSSTIAGTTPVMLKEGDLSDASNHPSSLHDTQMTWSD